MKQSFLFILLLCLFSISFSQTQPSIIGTWKLVSGKMMRGDSTVNYNPSNLNSLKIVTATHFAVFGQMPDGSFSHASAGTVNYSANSYTEKITFGSMPHMLGKEARFSYTLTGDTWSIKGGTDAVTFEETWTKVK